MTIARKIVIDTGLVLAAGAALALSGGAAGVIALAGFDAPAVQTSSAPGCVLLQVSGAQPAVGTVSPPNGCTVLSTGVGGFLGGITAARRCVDVRTPNSSVSVGSASAPGGCLTIRVPGSVGGYSVPVGGYSAPVGNASAPTCVVVTTPGADVRVHC